MGEVATSQMLPSYLPQVIKKKKRKKERKRRQSRKNWVGKKKKINSSQSLPLGISFETPGPVQPVLSFKEEADNFEDLISQGTKDKSLCQVVIRCLMLSVVGCWRRPSSVDLWQIKFQSFNLRKDLQL